MEERDEEEWISIRIRENLQRIMDERGMSAREVTAKAGTGRTAVSDILSGKSKSPGALTLDKIARALNVTIVDLVTGHPPGDLAAYIVNRLAELDEDERQRAEAVFDALVATRPKPRG